LLAQVYVTSNIFSYHSMSGRFPYLAGLDESLDASALFRRLFRFWLGLLLAGCAGGSSFAWGAGVPAKECFVAGSEVSVAGIESGWEKRTWDGTSEFLIVRRFILACVFKLVGLVLELVLSTCEGTKRSLEEDEDEDECLWLNGGDDMKAFDMSTTASKKSVNQSTCWEWEDLDCAVQGLYPFKFFVLDFMLE
jgi:hypothetical protein